MLLGISLGIGILIVGLLRLAIAGLVRSNDNFIAKIDALDQFADLFIVHIDAATCDAFSDASFIIRSMNCEAIPTVSSIVFIKAKGLWC